MKITVAGTGMRGSGYPNAENTIRILREHSGWQVDDRAHWMPAGMSLWKSAGGSRVSLLVSLLRLLGTNFIAALALMLGRYGSVQWVYAPYPAVFLLWWLSWVPRSRRPRVVADAYISLWDSAFRDRAMADTHGLAARLAKRFEGRALRAAQRVFVDTTANRQWMIAEFGIRSTNIDAIPLAIDDRVFAADGTARPALDGRPLRVVYVGTLVPLHGVGIIVGAVESLAGNPDFTFQFVGDGQQASLLERLIDPVSAGISWSRQWLAEDGIAKLLSSSHISLGVFGGGGKASRVLPFKVYLSLAAGTPVMTQSEFSLPEGAPNPPLLTVEPDATRLASKLVDVAEGHVDLAAVSRASRDYYLTHLGPGAIARAWSRSLGLPDAG